MNLENTLAFLLTFPANHARRRGPLLQAVRNEVAKMPENKEDKALMLRLVDQLGADDAALWDLYTLVLEHDREGMYDVICNQIDAPDAGPRLTEKAALFMRAMSAEKKRESDEALAKRLASDAVVS